jgi:hypothetical protein
MDIKTLKKKNITGSLVIIILLTSFVICGYSTGITGITKKPGSVPGCTCHADQPSPSVNVTITGPDTLIMNAEAIYTLTITGGPLSGGGTDIAVSSGTLTNINSDLIVMNSELTHFIPKGVFQGSVTFQFKYKAPTTPGTVTIYANGNSVNFNGINTGDEWNFAPDKTIVISDPIAGIKDNQSSLSFSLEQNYPNPFNPSTVIRYSIPFESNVIINFYNALGKSVREVNEGTRNSGVYELNFNSEGLASGVYFYSIKAASIDGKNNFSVVKKMMLIK